MKAIIVPAPGGLDRLKLVDRPDPGAPGPGQIRVALHATSLNFHDYLICAGKLPTADGRVPMADAGGVVEAIGEEVSAYAVGDLVVSCFFPDWQDGAPKSGDFRRVPGDGIDGFACETAVAPASAFALAPAGYSAIEAATITTAGLTAWRALISHGGLKAGDSVLVLGTGGVSIWALQLARAMGARVAATSSSDEKLEKLGAIGAEFTVNYRARPDWGVAVREWTEGRGVDHVIEVGGAGTLAQSVEAAKIAGHIHLIGVLAGRAGEVPTAKIMAKQIRLEGLIVGNRRQQLDFVRAIEATKIRPVIDRTFPLEALADAFRYEEAGRHFGKICVGW